MKIEVNQDDLIDLCVKLCELGKELDIEPEKFAIMLSICAKHLCYVQGIDVKSERVVHA